ncbi:hypothetical protein CLV48_1241 [Cecembia rubra]|uniref:Uncharacterized protein n=1 Tax=Cecembia rubra TaxID=1485585 RepID=A0A2P8DI59_9BACT|nr:hypothetical protein CLV48_1241 [Cecembia rubra]
MDLNLLVDFKEFTKRGCPIYETASIFLDSYPNLILFSQISGRSYDIGYGLNWMK